MENSPLAVLEQYFGYSSFRPMQEEIVNTVLAGQDSLVLMPTGGGKSICFQIPALVKEGTCIVVSPLIALMKDQVEGLKANGVPAAFLNSSLSSAEEAEVRQQARTGALKLLYVSPETMVLDEFQYFLESFQVSMFAIDEAHCVSFWGHDFRPEYTQLGMLKKRFPDVPMIALTATADKLTRKDILQQLKLSDPEVFVASFDRPNLSLTVLPGRDRFKFIEQFVRQRSNQSGIIYCLSRKSTETVATKLRAAGFTAQHYHAGMSPDERSRIQDAFINDEIPIICATIAFGMGIDKSNVRWVIHYNLPKNLESYYQEIGRAGRDGVASETILFYSFADVIQHRKFIEESEQKEVGMAKLDRMQQYADAQICRRKILLNYFGEPNTENCGNCDVCLNPPTYFDGTTIAQKALSAIYRMQEKVSTGVLIDVLRGARNQNVYEYGYQNIKTYGAGKDHSYQDWQQFILQLLHQGLVDIAYDDGHSLKLTALSKQVLFEGNNVELIQPEVLEQRAQERTTKKKPKTKTQVYEETLFEALRALRKSLAQKAKVPAYHVFSDASLKQMAAERPVSEPAMKSISGVGDRKWQLYGELFINAILEHAQEQSKEKVSSKGSTFLATLKLHQQGLTPKEIAEQRELNINTINTHLAKLYEDGHAIDLFELIDQSTLEKALEAIDQQGNDVGLKAIHEALNGEVEYHHIRFALAYHNVNMS